MKLIPDGFLKPRQGTANRSLEEILVEAFRCGESINSGDRKRSITLYGSAIDQQPACAVAWFNQGVVESRSGNWRNALKCLNEAANNPDLAPIAGFAKIRLMAENGQRATDADLPDTYRGKNRDALSAHGACLNAAHELRNRGHHCTTKLTGKTGVIRCDAGGSQYMMALSDVAGLLMQQKYRVDGENRLPLPDPRALSDSDREIAAIDVSQLSLVQAPVSDNPDQGWYRSARTVAERKVGRHGWVRVGQTFSEIVKRSASEFGNRGMLTPQSMAPEQIARTYWGEGGFLTCVLQDEPHAIAMVTTEDTWFPTLPNSVRAGTCVFSSEFFPLPEYPIVHIGLGVPVRLLQDGKVGVTICEHVANFAEANFQDWVAAVRAKQYTIVDVVSPDGRLVVSGRTNLRTETVEELHHCVNRGNSHAKAIPPIRLDYKIAVGRFYKEYPEPFFRSTRQATARF